MNITVYTTAYNGYGVYLPNWILNALNQSIKPTEIIIVLGSNHKADIKLIRKMLKLIKYKIIISKNSNMGYLRNLAKAEITTKWELYFSVDDILYWNAIEEIKSKQKYNDVVALRFIDRSITGLKKERSGCILEKDDIKSWRKFQVPAYIAVRHLLKGQLVMYKEIDIPNYPYVFDLARRDARMCDTDNVCAMYVRRPNSHHKINNNFSMFKIIINDYANEEE